MSKVFINEETLTAIGDAIREKNGSTDLIAPGNMADTIRNLPSGGGDGIDYLEQLINREIVNYENKNITQIGASLGNYKLDGLFSNTPLESINLPNLTNIQSSYTFYGCENLVSVELPELIFINGSRTFSYCASLEELNLPKFQYSIAYLTCQVCGNLKYVQLPSCGSLNTRFFGDCSSLKALVLAGSFVELNNTAELVFERSSVLSGTGFIYVPDDLVDTYKTATNWTTIADQILPLSSYPGEAGGYPALISVPEEV